MEPNIRELNIEEQTFIKKFILNKETLFYRSLNAYECNFLQDIAQLFIKKHKKEFTLKQTHYLDQIIKLEKEYAFAVIVKKLSNLTNINSKLKTNQFDADKLKKNNIYNIYNEYIETLSESQYKFRKVKLESIILI